MMAGRVVVQQAKLAPATAVSLLMGTVLATPLLFQFLGDVLYIKKDNKTIVYSDGGLRGLK